MKKFIPFALIFLFTVQLKAQTLVFAEDFESSSLKVKTYAASKGSAWGLSRTLQSNGQFSDSAKVQQGDTLFLETEAFDTRNYSNLQLTFNHICKVDFFDKAILEVSNDSGQNWLQLSSQEYKGSAFFNQNTFSALSYAKWLPLTDNAIPTNGWWKKDTFNLSKHLNSKNSMLRFVLIDADNSGASNNYGWLLDEIKIIGANCELDPPLISLNANHPKSKVYHTGPYSLSATVFDSSGIDTVQLIYTVNSGPAQTLKMQNTAGNIYQASIPAAGIGDSICYFVRAVDQSNCSNVATYPASCVAFVVGASLPSICNNNAVSIFDYQEDFSTFIPGNGSSTIGTLKNGWENDPTASDDWFVYDKSTASTNTGPSSAYFGSNYMYVEASRSGSETAKLLSPCFDLDGIYNATFQFRYHMYGNRMGSLSLDIYSNGQWHQNVIPKISGDQGNQWKLQQVDLSLYAGQIVKFRFTAETTTSFRSDIAIDQVELIKPPDKDLRIAGVIAPSDISCSSAKNQLLTLTVENVGAKAQSNIPLVYRYNTTVVRDTIRTSLAAGQQINYSFQQAVDMSAPGLYKFDFWLEANDANSDNDSLMNYKVNAAAIKNTFPDSINFDNFTVGDPGTFLNDWSNDLSAETYWRVNNNNTPSGNTGPSGDHTSGTGNYLYIEATSNENASAILRSECYDISMMNIPQLQFYTHMYGIDMGELHLDISVNGIVIEDIMPVISGNQGNSWQKQVVDLSPYRGNVKLLFRGITGNNYRSDIAIDDFSIIDLQPVGISKELSEKEEVVSIYPNPSFDGLFNIEGLAAFTDKQTLKVYSALGDVVYQDTEIRKQQKIDLSEFAKGVYWIEILSEQQRIVKKIIIQ